MLGSFFKKRLQHKFFPVKFAKFFKKLFLQNPSDGCFCQYEKLREFLTNFDLKVLRMSYVH